MKIAELRTEHQLISEWITEGARVLDLGCGDGGFLAALNKEKSVTGYGIEIDSKNIVKCIEKGVNVIQANLDQGLIEFEEGSEQLVNLATRCGCSYAGLVRFTQSVTPTNEQAFKLFEDYDKQLKNENGFASLDDRVKDIFTSCQS